MASWARAALGRHAKAIAKWGLILVAAFAVAEWALPVPPMELFVQELDLSVPVDPGSDLTFEPEFIKHVAQVSVRLYAEEIVMPLPSSLAFDTVTPGACSRFHLVYSARDRRAQGSLSTMTIRPRASGVDACVAKLDVKSSSSRRQIEIPADAAVVLQLKDLPSDPLLDNQRVAEIDGPTRKTKGGPFSLTQTEVEVDKAVVVRGDRLSIQSMTLSNERPDGELRLSLVAKRPPAVTVDGANVSILQRLKTVMTMRDAITGFFGHSK